MNGLASPHYNNIQKDVISNVVSLHPTGRVQFDKNMKLLGSIANVKNTQTLSNQNLKKVNENEYVCNTIETFSNKTEMMPYKKYMITILLLCILFLLIISFILFICK